MATKRGGGKPKIGQSQQAGSRSLRLIRFLIKILESCTVFCCSPPPCRFIWLPTRAVGLSGTKEVNFNFRAALLCSFGFGMICCGHVAKRVGVGEEVILFGGFFSSS